MRVVAVTAAPPWPVRSGYQTRCAEILSRLARRHEVALACVARRPPPEPPGWVRALAEVVVVPGGRTTAWSLARACVSKVPHHVRSHATPALRHAVASLLGAGADVLYLHYLYFAPCLPAGGSARPGLVLDQHNLDHEVWDLMAAAAGNKVAGRFLARQARLVRRFEREHLPRFDAVLAVSRADALATSELLPAGAATRVVVVPNGADVERFAPRTASREGAPPTVVFTGTDARRNLEGLAWFLATAWPRVLVQVPEARLVVAGRLDRRKLPRSVRRAAGVEWTGEVADVAPFLAAADVAVAPVRQGGGTKIKVVEALASGLPVVLSPRAAAGLDLVDGVEAIVREEAEEQAAAIAALLADPPRRRRMGQAGRERVVREHDWDQVAARVDTELAAAAAGRHGKVGGACAGS